MTRTVLSGMNNKSFSLKIILIAMLILFFQGSAISQNKDFVIYRADTLKKGVYKNFNEFKYNKPSRQTPPMTVKTRHHNTLSNSIISYKVQYNKDSVKFNEGEFWGYCDGKNIYINRNPDIKPEGKIWCEKIIKLDRLCFYNEFKTEGKKRGRGYMGPGGGTYMGGDSGADIASKFLDISNGGKIELEKSSFANFLYGNDRELYNAFEKEKKNKEMLFLYMEKFCEKHRVEF